LKDKATSSFIFEKQLVAGSVMEGASMMFHGDYKKRCLLTIMVSQILLLTQLKTEIKNLLLQTDFSLQYLKNCKIKSFIFPQSSLKNKLWELREWDSLRQNI